MNQELNQPQANNASSYIIDHIDARVPDICMKVTGMERDLALMDVKIQQLQSTPVISKAEIQLLINDSISTAIRIHNNEFKKEIFEALRVSSSGDASLREMCKANAEQIQKLKNYGYVLIGALAVLSVLFNIPIPGLL